MSDDQFYNSKEDKENSNSNIVACIVIICAVAATFG